MPLKTFLNLSEERQKEVLNACFEEFAWNDYESASLSRIIAKLGLAKGSFYRYFESKKDLYFYLVDCADSLISSSFASHMNVTGKDFFTNWTDFFLSLAMIEKDYPMIIRFRFKTTSEKSSEVSQNSRAEIRRDRALIIAEALKLYQNKGEIRKDIDTGFVSLFMMYFNFALSDFIMQKYNINKGDPVFSIPEEILRRDVDNLIKVLKEGLQTRAAME